MRRTGGFSLTSAGTGLSTKVVTSLKRKYGLHIRFPRNESGQGKSQQAQGRFARRAAATVFWGAKLHEVSLVLIRPGESSQKVPSEQGKRHQCKIRGRYCVGLRTTSLECILRGWRDCTAHVQSLFPGTLAKLLKNFLSSC